MIHVSDFGPINSDTIDAALASVSSPGCVVVFPSGKFALERPINLTKNNTTILGECGSQPYPGMAATELTFPGSGIIITGQRCLVSGLQLTGAWRVGSPASFLKTGISVLGTRAEIRNCGVYGFDGTGCSINGVVPTNNNLFQISNSYFCFNSSHGLYINGSNANAGLISHCSSTDNGGCGFHEQATLGNTYTACHADSNKLGAYFLYGPSMFSVLLGCYSEQGQPPSWIGQKVLAIGGDHGAGFDLTDRNSFLPGTILSSNGSGLKVTF